ncbi:MAG TPA: ABC transporter permease [Firmicutes bacterium]|nr:ABC transporter permease [Bacillota bacterium]
MLFKSGEFRLRFSIVVILLALWALFVTGNPKTFLSSDIYSSFMSTIPFSAIMALGLTLVVICGEIDLSFPSIMGFSGWVFSIVLTTTRSTALAMISCLATGVVAGLLNGLLVVRVGIPSLVATVGTMFFWRGAAMVASGGLGKTLVFAKGTGLFRVLVGRIGGFLPAQMIWLIGFAILISLVLNRHKFGNHIYFTGDNPYSARVMGIPVGRVKALVFAQLGLLAAFAGVLSSLEVAYYWPTLGEGYLLPTMAAVFVGGTSVFGGTGTIFGTFIGALIIGCLEAGIVSMGLTGFWTQLIYGLVIVISLSVYSLWGRKG